ncbi:MAG: NHLP leader peptide family RiPP precursor [Thermoflexales bacterium]|nr:NHLP leader peptide family RiPP precursor [Thermoflexales bacterium]
MDTLTYATRQAMYECLIFRLTEEPELRAALLSQPGQVLAEEMGWPLPAGVELRVVEDTALQHHVVIPWLSAVDQAEAVAEAADPLADDDEEEAVVRRALQDEGFRQRLLANPKAALDELFGFCLPAGAEITVLEETPQLWYFVCPPQLDLVADELEDWELEAVAGGASSNICCYGGNGQGCDGSGGSGNQTFSIRARSQLLRRSRYPICH